MANTGKIKKHNRQRQYLEQMDSLQQQLDTANKLIDTIKEYCEDEIETAKENPTPDDVDSWEFGVFDGRLEFAESLLAIIWSELMKKGVTK